MFSSSMGPSGIVFPGGCYLQGELIRCALDEFHCQGLEFRSARQMKERTEFGDGSAERCRRPHPDYVGMCTSGIDNFHCTGDASGCVISSKFIPNVPYCTVQHNHFPGRDTHLALYGSCETIESDGTGVSKTCVWSIDDCAGAGTSGSVTYVPASYAKTGSAGELCTCDVVQTGACVLGSDWTCAVSADACDAASDFRSWREVQMSGRDCRLCEEFDKTEVVSTDRVHPWAGGGGGHDHSHDHPNGNDDHDHSHDHGHDHSHQGLSGGSCQRGVVVATAVGGVLIALVLTLLVVLLCRDRVVTDTGRRSDGNNNNNNVNKAPIDEDAAAGQDTEEGVSTNSGTMA